MHKKLSRVVQNVLFISSRDVAAEGDQIILPEVEPLFITTCFSRTNTIVGLLCKFTTWLRCR